jgi:LysM repeat protein
MHEQPTQSPARVLAPLALLVCAIAFFAILLTGGGGDNGDKTSAANTAEKRLKKTPKSKRRTGNKATYTVKTGDTLGGIAAKTGLSVEQLQTLNPELDPQALISGQKIKLRE